MMNMIEANFSEDGNATKRAEHNLHACLNEGRWRGDAVDECVGKCVKKSREMEWDMSVKIDLPS